MAKVLKCTFKRVNGDNTGAYTRTKMGKSSPSPGILYMRNCPDGKTFYCDPNDGGTNSYYKLINPSQYGIKYSGTVYAFLSTSFLTGWTLVDDPASTANQQAAQIASQIASNKATPVVTEPPITGTKLTLTDYASGYSTDGVESVWYNTSGESVAHKLKNVKSTFVKNDYGTDYSFISDQMKIIEKNLNIAANITAIKDIQYDMMTKFNRFLVAYPDLQLSKTFSHVFFTRPDLNIYDDDMNLSSTLSNDPTFYYLDKNNKTLLQSLTKRFNSDKGAVIHDFNPILSNMASSFDLSDESLDVVEHGETFTGHKVKYGRHNIKSKVAGSFSISYTDDYDYRIYKLHKAWTDYISSVYRGVFRPKDIYRKNRILDYACSVYYFICGPDGETILFWSKYTGVFPTHTPSAASSWSKGSMVKMPEFSINYEYAWKEDFNPLSLAEFNINSVRQKTYKYSNSYESELVTTGKTFVGAPFIESLMSKTNEYTFKLRFRTPND